MSRARLNPWRCVLTVTGLSLLLFVTTPMTATAQDDLNGGLCGTHTDTVHDNPVLVLRYELIDQRSHVPIRHAQLAISGAPLTNTILWYTGRNGVGVLVVNTPQCIPSSGTVEITHPGYQYVTLPIAQFDLLRDAPMHRFSLQGHEHENWTDGNHLPSAGEIIDKVAAHAYLPDVSQVNTGLGFLVPNYGPGLFEYQVQMAPLSSGERQYRPARPPAPASELGGRGVRRGTESRSRDQIDGQRRWSATPAAFDEAHVRYIMADMSLGGPLGFYEQHSNRPDVAEALRRWRSGVRVANSSDFARVIVPGKSWQIVYRGTERTIDGRRVRLTTDR